MTSCLFERGVQLKVLKKFFRTVFFSPLFLNLVFFLEVFNLIALPIKLDLFCLNQSLVPITHDIAHPLPRKDVSATITGIQVLH